MQQSIHNITDDVENCHMAYVTHEDICRCFEEDTMLAIQAPSGTELEVPVVEQVSQNLAPEIALLLCFIWFSSVSRQILAWYF
jgi:hypothetical protein